MNSSLGVQKPKTHLAPASSKKTGPQKTPSCNSRCCSLLPCYFHNSTSPENAFRSAPRWSCSRRRRGGYPRKGARTCLELRWNHKKKLPKPSRVRQVICQKKLAIFLRMELHPPTELALQQIPRTYSKWYVCRIYVYIYIYINTHMYMYTPW